MKRFVDLTEQEVLALAITNEEEDSRIYRGFAEGLREHYPASAKMFDEMAEEEVKHRGMLLELASAATPGGKIPGVRSPIVIDGEAMASPRPSPRLGEHTEEILREIGES